MGHACTRLYHDTGVDMQTPRLLVQHPFFACLRARFTERASAFRKIEQRDSSSPYHDNRFFTGSGTGFAFTPRALTLKKRFIQRIGGTDMEGRTDRLSLQSARLDNRAEKIPPRCHLFDPLVHYVKQVGFAFQGRIAELRFESVLYQRLEISLGNMAREP
jgi:hypothetical protein